MKIEILERLRVIVKPSIDEEAPMIAVTYKTDTGIVRTVWIDEEKATEENIQKLILADLEAIGVKPGEVEWITKKGGS